jgi:Family of unknown function (DUF5681)
MTIGKPFKKGQSGNPGGRPKAIAEIRELAREHTGEAVETLMSIMTDPKAAPAARVSAANALLDRGYGKPPQHITGEVASYVARLPEPAKTVEEWQASIAKPINIQALPGEDTKHPASMRNDRLKRSKTSPQGAIHRAIFGGNAWSRSRYNLRMRICGWIDEIRPPNEPCPYAKHGRDRR